jgi:hypothetical protein
MTTALYILHWSAGFVVLAEALNKLERTSPLRAGICPRTRLVDSLKALAWLLLAMGAASAVATPLLLIGGFTTLQLAHYTVLGAPMLRLEPPGIDQVCVLAGFAVLIVRTRVKEG